MLYRREPLDDPLTRNCEPMLHQIQPQRTVRRLLVLQCIVAQAPHAGLPEWSNAGAIIISTFKRLE